MHEYYRKKSGKLRKEMEGFLKTISAELEKDTGRSFSDLNAEIWDLYEKEMLERFPYIGGDSAGGTKNLTGAFMLVAMGEVLKKYAVNMETIGYRMVQCFESVFGKTPGIVRFILPRITGCSGLMTKVLTKRAEKAAANAAVNPGSFQTEALPPNEKYSAIFHNTVCPLSDFAKAYGYEDYMPYLCNVDYVTASMLNIPLRRTNTCFEDGDYCDFMIQRNAKPLPYWPLVSQGNSGCK